MVLNLSTRMVPVIEAFAAKDLDDIRNALQVGLLTGKFDGGGIFQRMIMQNSDRDVITNARKDIPSGALSQI